MKRILIAAAVAFVPAALHAAPLIPVVGSAGAGWHALGTAVDPTTVDPATAPDGVRNDDFWAGYSYDRADAASGSTACGAGALVLGYPCDFRLGAGSGIREPIGSAAPGDEVFYWGQLPGTGTDPNFNADTSFYFSGQFELDLQVLSEMTAWKDGVEIGWYVKDDPNATTTLIGGPTGIPKDGDGNYILGGPTAALFDGDYGFYYKNYETGTAYYTQSELNHLFLPLGLTPYLGAFGLALDDEFPIATFDPTLYQQWALFGAGDRFWLGLEDIFGPTTPCAPGVPCSDYDYNDFLIGGTVLTTPPPDVPEPTTLAMLAIGLFGSALALRRRRSE